MATIDAQTKGYLRDPKRFADAFNVFLYGGRQVLSADNLVTLDSAELVTQVGKKEIKSLQKQRDVLKLYAAKEDRDGRGTYVILGIEAQTKVHYAMPVRTMLYDAMQYSAQIQSRAKELRANKTAVNGEEFLSGLRKEDLLKPVVTLVISFSSKKWDGARSLHEMLEVPSKELLEFLPDYKLNLLSPADMEDTDFDKFMTGLGAVLQFIKHSDEDSLAWIQDVKRFKTVDMESAKLIETLTGTDMKLDEKGEMVDMCRAWENSMKESYNSGIEKGVAQGRNEGVYDSTLHVARKFHLTPEEALEATGVAEADWGQYIEQLKKELPRN